MKISIGSDHAGFVLKEYLKKSFPEIEWFDEGTSNSERVDYPDFAARVAKKVASQECDLGVLTCGSGIGMAISANKISGIRAASVESKNAAALSRAHNDTNILCLGARILTPENAKDILETWLKTEFEGGRHNDRIKKISKIENENK